MSKMKVEVIPCSATPLIYDEEKCIGCNACAEICQCDIILPNPEKETSDRDVSGRMLLLWSLRDGMSEKRRTPSAASGDEPCKIRLGKAGTRKLEGD